MVVRQLTPPPSLRRPQTPGTRAQALSTAAHEQLAGRTSPLGAAVVAAVTALDLRDPKALSCVADAWARTEGLVFAARAVAESSGFSARLWHPGRGRRPRLRLDGGGTAAFEPLCLPVTRRIRALLAVASDRVYAEVTRALSEYRNTRAGRMVSSFLVPTRQDWVTECCAEERLSMQEATALLRSVSTATQLAAVLDSAPGRVPLHRPEVLFTAADGLGTTLVPFLRAVLENGNVAAAARARVAEVLAWFGTEESLTIVASLLGEASVPRLLRAPLRRTPEAGLRTLAAAAARDDPGSAGPLAERLLRELTAERPGLVAESRSRLSAPHRASVDRAGRTTVARSSIPLDETPSPAAGNTLPPPVPGLVPSVEPAIAWLPGEQADWLAEARNAEETPWPRHDGWAAVLTAFSAGELSVEEQARLFAEAPAELTGTHLDGWRPALRTHHHRLLRPIVARHGLAALPLLFSTTRRRPERAASALLPVIHPDVAARMARWLRREPAQWIALDWLARHPAAAADLLIVQAGGHPQPAWRASAVDALRVLIETVGSQLVVDAAARHAGRADRVVASLLRRPPAVRRAATLDGWTSVDALPPIRLRDRTEVLADSVVGGLLRLLSRAHPGRCDPGIAAVRARCDPASLAAFGRALFAHAQRGGDVVPHTTWVLRAQALIGDDETARLLGSLIHHGGARARQAVDVLATLGSDAAMEQLRWVLETTRSPALRSRAQDRLVGLVSRRGMTVDEAVESATPDLGFAADGTRMAVGKAGPITVVLAQGLVPSVVEPGESAGPGGLGAAGCRNGSADRGRITPVGGLLGTGGVRRPPASPRAVPHAGPPTLAVLTDQLARVAEEGAVLLERALRLRRGWSYAEFRRRWVEHPLLVRLAQGLVWTACEPGSMPTAFRITEDGSAADVDDDTVWPGASALVELPHPLRLGADLDRWSRLFADYEIIQPIPQLGRASHHTRPENQAAALLPQAGGTVTEAALRRLLALSWRWGAVDQHDRIATIRHPVSPTYSVVLEPAAGFFCGDGASRFRLRDVRLAGPVDDPWCEAATARIEELDAVAFSIVLDDLRWLTE